MKFNFAKYVPLFFLSALIGCGDSGSSSDAEELSSSGEYSSSESSSSYSNRLDVTYLDTLDADTLSLSEGDSTVKNPSVKLFLGEYPKGTLIRIDAKNLASASVDSFFVREEQGATLIPEVYSIDESGDTVYNIQINYGQIGDSTAFITDKFITTAESGFYYLDIPKITTGKSGKYTLRIAAAVSEGYYAYAGDSSTISLSLGDTVRGFFILGNSADSASASITATTGLSVNIKATGKSISAFRLGESGTEIDSGLSIDRQILPRDTETYTISVTPRQAADYTTGPYAYFEIATSSRELGQGEYFAYPDSIQKAGDTLTIVRERNDDAKYYLRQEQYVWLADLAKGDTINIYHEIEGYYTGASYPATYAVLDASGDSIANVTASQHVFVAPAKGPYYLHYVRLNSPPNTDSQTLTLKTMIQRLHYVTEFSFYDEESGSDYDTKSVADTLRFADLSFRVEPSDASGNALYLVPCSDLGLLVTAYGESDCLSKGTEQLLGAEYIRVSSSNAGSTFSLIAKSVADTTARDTLTVVITP